MHPKNHIYSPVDLSFLFSFLLFITKFLVYCSDELKKIVTSDLRKLLGAEGEPSFVKYVINLFSVLTLLLCSSNYAQWQPFLLE